jgi:hypothetical protein
MAFQAIRHQKPITIEILETRSLLSGLFSLGNVLSSPLIFSPRLEPVQSISTSIQNLVEEEPLREVVNLVPSVLANAPETLLEPVTSVASLLPVTSDVEELLPVASALVKNTPIIQELVDQTFFSGSTSSGQTEISLLPSLNLLDLTSDLGNLVESVLSVDLLPLNPLPVVNALPIIDALPVEPLLTEVLGTDNDPEEVPPPSPQQTDVGVLGNLDLTLNVALGGDTLIQVEAELGGVLDLSVEANLPVGEGNGFLPPVVILSLTSDTVFQPEVKPPTDLGLSVDPVLVEPVYIKVQVDLGSVSEPLIVSTVELNTDTTPLLPVGGKIPGPLDPGLEFEAPPAIIVQVGPDSDSDQGTNSGQIPINEPNGFTPGGNGSGLVTFIAPTSTSPTGDNNSTLFLIRVDNPGTNFIPTKAPTGEARFTVADLAQELPKESLALSQKLNPREAEVLVSSMDSFVSQANLILLSSEEAGLLEAGASLNLDSMDQAMRQILSDLEALLQDLARSFAQLGLWPWLLAGLAGVALLAEWKRRRLHKESLDTQPTNLQWFPELGNFQG